MFELADSVTADGFCVIIDGRGGALWTLLSFGNSSAS